jgi:ribosomal protein S18 acetylase RimI-like enzyme
MSDGYMMNLTRGLDDIPADGQADQRVRPVTQDDIEDRAAITHAAFEKDKPLDEYVADYAGFFASPAYPHGWDLLLRDENGRAAACCIAWIDPISRAATFEPVATHPDLHRRGYAKALLQEGLRRFAAAGMAWAIIGTRADNPRAEAAYRSVGFLPDRLLREYERPSG